MPAGEANPQPLKLNEETFGMHRRRAWRPPTGDGTAEDHNDRESRWR